jgi:hypothetical protein
MEPMAAEHRSLLMRANRLLGVGLVESNLVKVEDLEPANERLFELLAANAERQASLLGVLLYEKKVLAEDALFQHLVEEHGVGMIDLRSYEVPDDIRKTLKPGPSWATWTVRFDQEEEFHFLATAYYLSSAVRTYWERQLKGQIIWYATSLEGITEFLEKVELEKPKTPAGAPSV